VSDVRMVLVVEASEIDNYTCMYGRAQSVRFGEFPDTVHLMRGEADEPVKVNDILFVEPGGDCDHWRVSSE
jgi:hypothetical protein